MATFKEIVYSVLDLIKSVNGDSYITEEHVIFLANLYRLYILLAKVEKQGELSISSSNQLTICLDLEETKLQYPCLEVYLKSIQEVPDTIAGTTPHVYPDDYFNSRIVYITKDRMKFVGYNKYMQNIIYCCILDNHVLLKSSNPQYRYLEKIKVTGVFEDAEKAAELSCDKRGEDGCIDILDTEYPLSGDLVPTLIDTLVKQLLNALYRPADDVNNSSDDIAELVQYVRRNMKTALAKLMTE